MRAVVVGCSFLLISCSPVSPDRFRFVELPQRFDLGVAGTSIQTTTHDVYISTIRGSWLRMQKGGTAWENLGPPGLSRVAPDFQQGKALGLLSNNGGVAIETATGFAPLDPAVNAPPGALLGRDQRGLFWSVASSTTHVLLSRWDVASAVWTTENLAYDLLPAGTETVLTGTGSVFMRPANKGLFEADRDGNRMVERVPCSHTVFRPSHPDFAPCQQDSTLVGDVDGSVLIATANHEVWRLSPGTGAPVLVVKGELQGVTLPVDANGNSIVGIPQVHLDSKRRLWLIYRLGLNVGTDIAELHVADSSGAPPSTWQRLRGDLERNMRLFGVGPTPVLSTGSEDQGLRVIRVDED